MNRVTSLLISLFMILSLSNGYSLSAPQKTKTEVIVYDEHFLPASGEFPLPKNAVELVKKFSLLSFEIKSPQRIADDPSGNIYITDNKKNAVLVFNSSGKYLYQLGRTEKKRGPFSNPNDILAKDDLILVQDVDKRRILYFDSKGGYERNIKISNFIDMTCNGQDLLFVAPVVSDKHSPIVEVYSQQGKRLASFGQPMEFYHSLSELNSRHLAVNKKGEIFVAFTYFPIVRKYSAKGELIAEYIIENKIMKAKEIFNLKMLGEGIVNYARRYLYVKVVTAIKALEDRVYLLSTYPRLEILEVDGEGKIRATYWKGFEDIYKAEDFIVQKTGNKKRFYVLQSYPDFDVDVFERKK